jgi:cytosine/adenosine deaminase-related metal-dependent hydrolase
MSILIKNTIILTQNDKREQVSGNIYIDDNKIIQISKNPLSIEADYKIDGKNKLVLIKPGNTNLFFPSIL